MTRKNINFESLREDLAFKTGTVIENLLKYNSLIKGLRQEINKIHSKLPSYNQERSCDLILEEFEKNLTHNIELVKEGSLRAIDLILLLEKEVVDKRLLQEETKILKEIVLSRENIMDWKGYARKILRKLRSVYPYDIFFFMYQEQNLIKIYIFSYYVLNETNLNSIKDFLKNYISSKLNIEVNKNIEFEEIYITERKRNKKFKNIHIETHKFLTDSPGIGGILGLLVLKDEKITKKERNILNSILSIMTLVTGSSRALSKAITELEYYAGHDPLTELYNRRIFEDLLKYEVSRAKRKKYKFSLILIDLDNFKIINDTYGHHVGDIILKSVADILEASTRDGDMVARVGGDEFVILLSETDLERALIVAERIRRNLEENKLCIYEGGVVTVSASLGVVEFPTHGKTKEELMMVVDSALFKAKDLGKNKVYVPTTEEIEITIKEKRKEFSALQHAIDNELFFPYYQPIYDLQKNTVFAYEVLARLKNENGEVISAYKFVSLAEKLGKIKEIDQIIIKKALQAKSGCNKGKKVFLNLSAKYISDSSFWEYVYDLVSSLKIKPEDIVFEITEREAVKETAEVQSLIIRLKERGFGFAIDDFGSGYSSFYYLKYFPIDYVKIDGEFIKEMTISESKSFAFVESMNLLCKRLEIKTVAEFIETKEVLELLKSIGIDYGQGYYLGRPDSKIL
ncbi:putative bifunctional diguanylate cyclase/phosphodiesterase [Persephonella sp.]